ncbi:AmmeMemoRadiSam system protein A [Pectinatus frisingensis]|uniref:AmmeMemoRadiSam system protein A n=1 Tax=Pectinatus frisingensis TaxID=865 RepID=UPI0018C5CAEE|nr:AmmeMemoRadiSam system protein A [Pectinatus frisingensis]
MKYFIGSALLPHPPIMIPEIGGSELGKMSTTVDSVKKIAKKIVNADPQTLVIISPHAPVFKNSVGMSFAEKLSGSMDEFGHHELSLTYEVDFELAEKIAVCCQEKNIPLETINKEFCINTRIHLGIDKGSFVPLYYLHRAGFKGKIIHLCMGFISYEEMMLFGNTVKNAIELSKKRTFILASGDLSHRLLKGSPNGYSPSGKIFDQNIMSALPKLDSEALLSMEQQLIDSAGECGLRPIFFLLGAMQGIKSTPQFVSYDGPFGVGYGTVLFMCEGIKDITHSDEVVLAKNSLIHYLKTGQKLPLPTDISKEMSAKAGVFVSLKKFGHLRGCIGTILPTQDNIVSEIINNAVYAGTQDPRFSPVTLKEADDIVFSVDILSTPELTTKEKLDPQKYGVITVTKSGKKGLLLPMLDGVDTVDEQISVALQKGHIFLHEKFDIYRFTVMRHY